MAQEVPQVRPAVISEKSRSRLDEYRGFRHVVRNVYTFKFDTEKVEKLATEVPGLFADISPEYLLSLIFCRKQLKKGKYVQNNIPRCIQNTNFHPQNMR